MAATRLESVPVLRKNIIRQVVEDEVDKSSPSNPFGFEHRPDTAIGLGRYGDRGEGRREGVLGS